MVTSTERETMQVRRKRVNQCRWRASLPSIACVWSLPMSDGRQGRVVGRPIVGAEQTHTPGLQLAQQAPQRDLVAGALPVD